MSAAGNVLKRIGHYSLAKLVIMVAGLVSYPILTRVLSPEEYGVMGLIITMLNLAIGVSKLGLQFSTVRMWAQWEEDPKEQERFILSFFLATTMASLAATLLYDMGNLLLRAIIGQELLFFILISSPLILLRSLQSFGMAQLNASQRSRAYALFEVAGAYVTMIAAVLGATVVIGGLRGYYHGLVLGEIVMVAALMAFILRGVRMSRGNFNFPLVKEAVTFGFPMSLFEMSGVLFYTGDRFIILWLLNKAQLGYYTVAYNLAVYINTVFTLPVTMTVTPAVTSIYEREGSEAASDFLGRASRWFFMFAFAAVAGLFLTCTDLLELLASEKFSPGAALVPTLTAGLLFTGGREILGAGMFLKKRPWLMARINLMGALLNAGLNLVLIPRLGIQGAAVATLLTQMAITAMFWVRGSRLVKAPVALGPLGLHAGLAAAMAGVIYFIDPGAGVLRLVLRILAGMAIYSALLLALDSEARELAKKVLARFR